MYIYDKNGIILRKSNISDKIYRVHQNTTRITGTSHEDQCTFMIRTELFSEREIFQTKFTEYIKTHILRSIIFSRDSCHLWDQRWQCNKVHKRCDVHDSELRQEKETHTHNIRSFFLFHGNNGYMNAPHCYAVRTLPVIYYDYWVFLTACLIWIKHSLRRFK